MQAQPSSRETPDVSGRAPLPILLFYPRLPNSLSGTHLPSLGVRQEETRSHQEPHTDQGSAPLAESPTVLAGRA